MIGGASDPDRRQRRGFCASSAHSGGYRLLRLRCI